MSLARDTADYGHIKSSRRNLIINGDLGVAQRGASFASVASSVYTLDRWFIGYGTTAVTDIVQGTNTDPLPFGNFYSMEVTFADTSIAPGDYYQISQRIEGYNFRRAMWGTAGAQPITISFYHAHTKTGTHCVSFRNDALNRSYVAEYTQAVANTWEKTVITIPGDTTGTWLSGSDLALSVDFTVASGSTYHATKDTWSAGNFIATSSLINNLDTVANFFRFTQVQLEIGTEATDFEARTYGEELDLCKRYFERIKPGVVDALLGAGYARSATSALAIVHFAEKRGSPSMAFSGNTDFSITHGLTPTFTASTAMGSGKRNPKTGRLTITVASGLTAGQGLFASARLTSSYIDVAAEL